LISLAANLTTSEFTTIYVHTAQEAGSLIDLKLITSVQVVNFAGYRLELDLRTGLSVVVG
jgi:hypothetical protein